MTHTIISRREVPVSNTFSTLSGKVHTEQNIHGGEKAVFVKLETGYMAWGFASTWESAEMNAISEATALQ